MVITKTARSTIRSAKTAITDMFKEQIVHIPISPFRDDATQGTPRFGAGFLEFEKIDVPYYRHSPRPENKLNDGEIIP
jgi:hypothetical protein